MKRIPGRLADALLSLYPARWRERYEEEFRDLLSECPLSLAIIADISKSARDAHVHFGAAARRRAATQRAGPYRPLRSLLG